MIETKDYITWGITITLAATPFLWNLYRERQRQKESRANIVLDIEYPVKILPSTKTMHYLDFHIPESKENFKYVNLTITNIGREPTNLKNLLMIIDGRVQEFHWQPTLMMHYKGMSADLRGDELMDYEYSSPQELGQLQSLANTFLTVRASIFSRDITGIIIVDINGKKWGLTKEKLKTFLNKFDKDNPIHFVSRTL